MGYLAVYATWRMIFNENDRKRILKPVSGQPGIEADFMDIYRSYFSRTDARHPLNRMLYVDNRLYLPNDMLVKADRMTMAHGLEARVPYLDHRLVEFASRLPPEVKIKQWWKKKYILKKGMKNRIPQKVILRAKAGFNIPKSRWIKNELRTFVMDLLSQQTLKDMGFIDSPFVAEILHQHFTSKADNSFQIWCLRNLSLWWNHFQK